MPILRRAPPRAFTLVELLVVITIIGILSSVLLGTLFFAGEKARDTRTRATISRLDQAITIRWESYRTRRIPIDVGDAATDLGLTPTNPHHVSLTRLLALRDLVRMELPDRWTDVSSPEGDPRIYGLARPAISLAYLDRYEANPTPPTALYQGAECLYMIVTMGGLGDDATLEDHFRHADVADTDEDGAPEFTDGWGRPIRFLRWAPGFVSDLQPDANPTTVDDPSTSEVENLDRDVMNNHDPFDPLKADLPNSMLAAVGPPKATGIRTYENPFAGFRLFPLIYSSGPDGQPDIRGDIATSGPLLAYRALDFPNDPYHDPSAGSDASFDRFIGSPFDADSDGLNHLDNIHNHNLAGQVR